MPQKHHVVKYFILGISLLKTFLKKLYKYQISSFRVCELNWPVFSMQFPGMFEAAVLIVVGTCYDSLLR